MWLVEGDVFLYFFALITEEVFLISFEKTLMLGKIEDGRRRGRQRMRWLADITDSMDMSLSKLWDFCDGQGSLACCSSWDRKELDMTEARSQLSGKAPDAGKD